MKEKTNEAGPKELVTVGVRFFNFRCVSPTESRNCAKPINIVVIIPI